MRPKKTDPELPAVLPFRPGPASNGEFLPRPLTRREQMIIALAHERGEELARRLRMDRRRFLMGLGGLAVTLGAVNAFACDSDGGGATATPGGTFVVPAEPSPEALCALLEGEEFIFDIQTHHVNPQGPWVEQSPASSFFFRELGGAQANHPDCTGDDPLECLGRYYYLHDIFLESDTTVAVLSDTPSVLEEQDPLPFDLMRETQQTLDALTSGGESRLLLHSIVVPNAGSLERQLDLMQARAETMAVAAWKVYTPYTGTTNRGWFLDDEEFGIPLIEQARATGVKMICVHKGLPLIGFAREYCSPRDIGVVAKAYPDMNFVVYHSGYDPDHVEGPYDPDDAELGTNSLIKSLLDNGVEPNSNVYAELGTTWRAVMSDPVQAAHVIGKLLRYVGEDRVCWGTDCIWTGSPQPQIVAFRSFQIDPELAQQYEYPELTSDVKAKVFGLNSAALYGVDPEARRCALQRDEVERYRGAWRDLEGESHEPRWVARGPITRRGMLRWIAGQGGRWSPFA